MHDENKQKRPQKNSAIRLHYLLDFQILCNVQTTWTLIVGQTQAFHYLSPSCNSLGADLVVVHFFVAMH